MMSKWFLNKKVNKRDSVMVRTTVSWTVRLGPIPDPANKLSL